MPTDEDSRGEPQELPHPDDVEVPTVRELWSMLREENGVLRSAIMLPTAIVVTIAAVLAERDRRREEAEIKREEQWRQEVRNGSD